MFRWLFRLIRVCIILALIAVNVLTLTSTAVNAFLSGAVAAALGIQTVSARMQSKLKQQTAMTTQLQNTLERQRTQVRTMGKSFVARTKRITLRSIAEIPASVIPFAGVALLVAGTVWEINQLCDGLKEMEMLYRDMDMDESIEQGTLEFVCNPQLTF